MAKQDRTALWNRLEALLSEAGVDLDALMRREGDDAEIKCVVVAPSFRGCVEEVARATRDQVVMVRVDDGTARALDAWVETGQLRSRSEAAAVFIKAGLKLHQDQLTKVSDALRDVEESKRRLAQRMKEVLGNGGQMGQE